MKKKNLAEYKDFLATKKAAIEEIICLLRDKHFSIADIVSTLDEAKVKAMYSCYVSSEFGEESPSENP